MARACKRAEASGQSPPPRGVLQTDCPNWDGAHKKTEAPSVGASAKFDELTARYFDAFMKGRGVPMILPILASTA
jgi:hypothetical protein